MARKVNYSSPEYDPDLYYRLANGTLIELVPNDELGITAELITIIRETNEEEHQADLNERYVESTRFNAIKSRQEAFQDSDSDDEIPRFGQALIVEENYSHSPEHILFPERKTSSGFMERVRSVIPMLTDDQQRLYDLLKEGFSYSEIADKEGTTKNAIYSRVKKLKASMLRLYSKEYGDL